MNDALFIAATGMSAQSVQLDVIANNVANSNTANFKRSSVRFGDLVSSVPAQGLASSSSLAGVMPSSVLPSFSAGDLRASADSMSLAIQGDGFFEVLRPDGGSAYARGGHLDINADRLLTISNGQVLKQHIYVPPDVNQLSVRVDGTVQGADANGRQVQLGRIELVQITNPAAMSSLGDGLWQANASAGDAQIAQAGEGGAGLIKQGFEEMSNVKLVDEMVQLMVAQRAYEMNVKVVQAADEVAGMTNNLRK